MMGWAGLLGAVNGALAVMAGAFGAHGLEARLAAGAISERQFEAFGTGADYHLWHAIALVLVGFAAERAGAPAPRFRLAVWLFLAGIFLFSGSLYLYGALGMPGVVMVTPIGGIALIAGWLAFAFALFTAARDHADGP